MTTQLALRLDDEQVRELDRIVIAWDDIANRSEAVRLAIAEFIVVRICTSAWDAARVS